MTNRSHYRIGSSINEELFLHVCVKNLKKPRAIVLFSSGFTVDGNESHRIFYRLADYYADHGIMTVTYDNIGLGYSDGDSSDFLISHAISDQKLVLNFINQQLSNTCPIFIHGQSLGTLVAIFSSWKNDRISGYILWNLSGNIRERYPRIFGDGVGEKLGFVIQGKGFFVNEKFLIDSDAYDILPQFSKFKNKPIFFLNAGADKKGDSSLGMQAFQTYEGSKDFCMIEGANHSFKGQRHLEKDAFEKSLNWLLAELE